MMHVDDATTQKANRAYIQDAMDADILTREQEQSLARRWKDHGDVAAMQELVSAYRKLVVAHAGKFRKYGLPIADLIQEGNIGLMEAVNRFEPDRDVRFSTYATWWVRSCLQDFVLRNWSIVRTGTTSSQKALFFNLRRLKAKIEGDSGLNADELRAKIANDMGLSVREVEKMEARLSGADVSLNLTIGEDGDTELQSTLPAATPSPEEVVIGMKDGQARSKWLNEALAQLSDREQRIIRQRHLAHEPVTLDALGHSLGISKERVRQIESRAMERLKTSLMGRVSTPAELYN